jgi:hypothetical protein
MTKEGLFFGNRIPLAVLGVFFFGLFTHTIATVWYLAKFDSRVDSIEKTLDARGAKGLETLTQTAQNTSDISGLKVEVTGLKDAIRRIDGNIQVIADKIYDEKRHH